MRRQTLRGQGARGQRGRSQRACRQKVLHAACAGSTRSRKRRTRRVRRDLVLVFGLVGSLTGCLRPNYLSDPVAIHPDLTIHVVIENPAGTNEKWEVRADGRLIQERVDGEPVLIPYLPWPVNAGMVPRTLMSEALGGDKEPLDVLVLGPARARGELVRAVPIGLLRVVDRLERDDKILAVVPGTLFGDIRDIAELEDRAPGVRETLEIWYAHSRPGGAIQVQGFGSRAVARRLIYECIHAFAEAERAGNLPQWATP